MTDCYWEVGYIASRENYKHWLNTLTLIYDHKIYCLLVVEFSTTTILNLKTSLFYNKESHKKHWIFKLDLSNASSVLTTNNLVDTFWKVIINNWTTIRTFIFAKKETTTAKTKQLRWFHREAKRENLIVVALAVLIYSQSKDQVILTSTNWSPPLHSHKWLIIHGHYVAADRPVADLPHHQSIRNNNNHRLPCDAVVMSDPSHLSQCLRSLYEHIFKRQFKQWPFPWKGLF